MYEQIARNKRHTFLMLGMFAVLIAALVVAFNYLLGFGAIGFAIAVSVAVAMAWGSYWYSDRIALRVSRALPADGSEYRRYHNLVEGLCIAAGLPKPGLYVVEDPAPNAFATGRNPDHAAIAVTTGLLEKMNRVELEGVLAHELSHIKNYDILLTTVAVTAVGAIALLADLGLRFMWFGGARRRGSSNAGPAGGILAIVALVLLVVAPLIATMMKFSLSRRRELQADATGVQITRYPPGLIAALEKLRDDQSVVASASRATEQLWIESPLERKLGKTDHKGTWLNRAFNTHPPLEQRIQTLKEM
jgi:heat shock protein HtpX